jgi:hypothetical protein
VPPDPTKDAQLIAAVDLLHGRTTAKAKDVTSGDN